MGSSEWEIVGTYEAITPDPITTDPIYAPERPSVDTATKKVNQATSCSSSAATKSAVAHGR